MPPINPLNNGPDYNALNTFQNRQPSSTSSPSNVSNITNTLNQINSAAGSALQSANSISITGSDSTSNEDFLNGVPTWTDPASVVVDIEDDLNGAIIPDTNGAASTKTGEIDSDDSADVYKKLLVSYNTYCATSSTSSIFNIKTSLENYFNELNAFTYEKFDITSFEADINALCQILAEKHHDILNYIKNEQAATDDANNGGGTGSGRSIHTGTFSQKSSSSGSTTTNNQIDNFLETTVVGTLLFTTIVPLYDQIGANSTIQSSLTTTYDVVGMIYENGKYYYRIYDKNLSKFYFAEAGIGCVFTTSYSNVLVSKEGEETMMLTSPETEKLNFAKMTDPNSAYFVKDQIENGNTFAAVLDGTDGNTYYIPMDNTVEIVDLNTIVPENSLVIQPTVSETSAGVSA